MTTSDPFDPDDVIIDGIVSFVEATGDKSGCPDGGVGHAAV